MKKYFLKSIVIFSLLIVVMGCSSEDEDELQAPIVTSETTPENVVITFTSIEIKGNVSSNPGNEITARGVCWSTNQNPTINNDKTTETSNSFTSTINDLVANTTYYFRVYATTSSGTSYGTEQSYSTSSLDGTMWDFFIIYSPDQSVNGDVIFYADGTTVYDEPDSPGQYTTYGTWSLSGNILSYDLDSSEPTNLFYQFTGTIVNNTMSGVFNWGSDPDKNFSAVMY
jgi:hypothetical protein